MNCDGPKDPHQEWNTAYLVNNVLSIGSIKLAWNRFTPEARPISKPPDDLPPVRGTSVH